MLTDPASIFALFSGLFTVGFALALFFGALNVGRR